MADTKQQKDPSVVGIDGIARKSSEEARINAVLRSVFGGTAGKEVLRYLRSVTIQAVCGPNVSNDELRHREGQRYLVWLIEARMQKAQSDRTTIDP